MALAGERRKGREVGEGLLGRDIAVEPLLGLERVRRRGIEAGEQQEREQERDQREREGRHVIVAITDGGDTTSSKKFKDALDAAQKAQP